MVWPVRKPALSSLTAMARAATFIAGLSRKLPASSCEASSDRTSRSSDSSPPQACFKNSARSAGGRSNADCNRLSTRFHSSESIICPGGQFAIEPGLGGAPIAHYGDGRDFEHLGRFCDAEPAKEAHFHHLHFTWIHLRQRVQCIIQRHQVRGPVAAHHGRLIQGQMLN